MVRMNKFWQVKLMYKINSESIGDVKKYVWHYRKDNNEYGPFTYEDIIEKVRNGEIGPDDYVLKFGNRKFVKVSEVQGLIDMINQPEQEQEEQAESSEEQGAADDKMNKEEHQGEFEKMTTQLQGKHKKDHSGQRIAMITAGLMGLGLAVWLLTRLI